jgi:cytochrome c-type biogenesis protein CcmH
LAVDPREVLGDPVLEQRAREISKGLRCLVCQNQSIDDSDADLARDLRRLVRRRLVSGDSDQQVIDYVVSRYGDFVLLKPPFKGATLMLWLGPVIIIVLGLIGLVYGFRVGAKVAPQAPLDAAEKRRLEALLKADGER